MNIDDIDIVFFGDSIIRGGNWERYFPEKKIINLGVSGDTIYGMTNRINMITVVHPKKVFICGGINSLSRYNVKLVLAQYKNMLIKIRNSVPNARIFVQSVLPISKSNEKWADNDTIILFNSELEKLTKDLNCTYINIHNLYTENGVMNPKLTKDGTHLQKDAYIIWVDAIKDYIDM